MEKISNKKTRDSNIELLRIVAMMMIVFHHISFHTKSYLLIGKNHFASLVLVNGGKIAVIIYILIKGYYSKESKVNISRPLILVVKVIIYSVLFMLIFGVYDFFNIEEYKQYWFINKWLIFIAIEPIIKICEKNLTKKILNLILVLIAILYLIPQKGLYDVEAFVYIYLFGRHILPKLVKILDNQTLNIFAVIILYFAIIVFDLGMRPYTTIIPLLTATMIFVLFANIKIKNNIINTIGKCTIGVYLIHDNSYVRSNIIQKLKVSDIFYSKFFFINMITIGIMIFAVCIILDYIVSKFIEKIIFRNKKLNEIISKINSGINKFIEINEEKMEIIEKKIILNKQNYYNNRRKETTT